MGGRKHVKVWKGWRQDVLRFRADAKTDFNVPKGSNTKMQHVLENPLARILESGLKKVHPPF